ncbi:unnamed protein product [Protopolystoma xenopodis]|uniref:Uncharacterized protein n=1 Tax=Protopolystoma xenopodis TaxID=117903 RepID=A0A3S5BSG6_9PLAT|nr:unnamed protein product [Protopolystoma xenopodis]
MGLQTDTGSSSSFSPGFLLLRTLPIVHFFHPSQVALICGNYTSCSFSSSFPGDGNSESYPHSLLSLFIFRLRQSALHCEQMSKFATCNESSSPCKRHLSLHTLQIAAS